jgi:hypothetical protein
MINNKSPISSPPPPHVIFAALATAILLLCSTCMADFGHHLNEIKMELEKENPPVQLDPQYH